MNDDQLQTMTLGAGKGNRWHRMVSSIRALAVWPALAATMLAACGDDGNGGNEDTLFTGLSGVVILGAVIYFVLRKVKSRN